MLTAYFPHNLEPSIVKWHTDHLLSFQILHLFVLSLYVICPVCMFEKNYFMIVIYFQTCTHIIINAH